MEEMLGSYAPGQTNEKKFPFEEAPSGMLARGKYDARSKFTDDDGHSYLDFTWSFEVTTPFQVYGLILDQERMGLGGLETYVMGLWSDFDNALFNIIYSKDSFQIQ
jgi:hypothetical protein